MQSIKCFFLSYFVLQQQMNQYFSARSAHLGHCDIDVSSYRKSEGFEKVVTVGSDNLILIHNIQTGENIQYPIEQEKEYSTIAIAADGAKCFLGSNKNVMSFQFSNKNMEEVVETLGTITSLKCSNNGKLIAIGSDEAKCIIYNTSTGEKNKCRPGHISGIISVWFSSDDRYVCSIGRDQLVLIYDLAGEEPQEVARYGITNSGNHDNLIGSFHLSKYIVYLPGRNQLQTLELVNSKWEYTTSVNIIHNSTIKIAETVKQNFIATSTSEQFYIWNIKKQEKIIHIDNFCLHKIVKTNDKFFGINEDGNVYQYRRQLREYAEQQPMDVEEIEKEDSERIQFEQNEGEDNQEMDEQEIQKQEYNKAKKTLANKLILTYPQAPLSTATQFFEGSRFLFVNKYGVIIENKQDGEDQNTIQVEFSNQKKMTLFKNQQILFFDLNYFAVLYAGEEKFGIKTNSIQYESWERNWIDIMGVAMGCGWVAIANQSQIKVFDMTGHEIKSISFDRQIVAIRAYENLLIVVYHESLPIYKTQQLSMQMFAIDSQITNMRMVINTHVPIKQESILRWINFTQEGMIISQDTYGYLRAFSLQTNEWTSVILNEIQDLRKVWIIQISGYQMNYWKISDSQPQPTVAPRFQPKNATFAISTIVDEKIGVIYANLLWQRYIIDHEKARSRLWGRFKLSRSQKSPYYDFSKSIITEKEIAKRHYELDRKYQSIISQYIQEKQFVKAINIMKSHVRSLAIGNQLSDLFDLKSTRREAISVESFFQQKKKQLEYEQIQSFELMKLRQEAQRSIRPLAEDPMKRNNNKKKAESIPSFSQNFSQDSFQILSERGGSIASKNNSEKKSVIQAKQIENPFVKKKSLNESFDEKKNQIIEQVQKFGLKKKAEDRNIQKKIGHKK